ncbi:putative transposase (Bacteriophage Mu, transposase 25-230; Transposase, Mu, C-terminal 244-310) [Magnetospirillum sp. XM-1]|uniref:transposase domain-containing protein n=1 Tax=Magnetospirillum sp. XM-1 TaxID=1663591 RepID=UPI00073DEC51|nr:transposase domain-containing protein [Magnetospirillum sp. XM-1]CUW41101.1 putative transposase (Bacteriophage Mu, transposase 25-230; Transposase, Mu, C-terminal 244-310) [Magnetospirillum sp. XM-1]
MRVLAREGEDALKRLYPAQTRDRSMFHALEAVNGDGHKFDVFVRWPDGEIGRPMMVAFQDLYSGKIVAWRVDKSENRDSIRLALGDLVEDWGIPEHIWFDNTRAFANKALTAGTASRFRFKVRDEDPVGLCALLGIQVHFTLPYSGQSKPIERAFRDLCDSVARHPAFAGAWCGNNPMAKPENYGSKAVDLDDFLRVLAEQLAEHNARPGRRSQVCGGVKSFDQAFAESYEISAIRKAEPEQRRLWLLAAEGVKVDRTDGKIKLLGNVYWSDSLHDHLGQPLIARFDPDDLAADLHVYRLDGGYIGAAACIDAAGFADAAAAREHGRARRTWMKAAKTMLAAERRMDAAEFAALIPSAAPPIALESKVVAPMFKAPNLGAVGARRPIPVAKPITEAEAAQLAALEAEMAAPAAPPVPMLHDPATRLRRILEIEARIEAGQDVPDDDRRWAIRQSRLPDIVAQRQLYEDFGPAALTA